jgi:hypothetical protein
VRKRGVGMVEISEIGCVNGGAGEDSRRKRGECLGWVLEERTIGVAVTTDKVGTRAGGFDNCVRAAAAVGEFSDSTCGSIAVDLDAGHDEVADSVGNWSTRLVDAFAMGGAAFFSEEAEDLFGKAGGRGGEAKEGVDVGGLIGSWGRGSLEAQIKGEAEGAADGGDAADNIGAIDGAAIPGVSSGVTGFDKDSVSSTLTAL